MNKEERIKILQDVIKIKSVNDKEAEVADYLANLFEKHGIESEKVKYREGRESLVATYKKGDGKVLGISGHEDVVAAGDESEWKFPPFSAEIDGDKLYGRGSSDMKSGLVALAIAMIEIKEEDADINGTLKFMGTVGEEVGELGSEQLTKEGYADDLDGLIIGEPTGPALIYTHKGSMNYTVVSRGKSAHSSMPKEGINSIANINEFVTRANAEMQEVTNKYKNEVLGETAHSITIINGGDQVNSIPAITTLQGNIRTIPEFDNSKVKVLLQSIVDDLNKKEGTDLELIVDYDIYPVESKADSELMKAIQAVSNQELPVTGISPTTDAAAFTKADNEFDLVIYGPGISDLPHQTDEYVSIENYLEMIDNYKAIYKEYLK
ncbi:ArgE/DapE family deacylase [Oceanobacillus chungangensis]|uniref:Probable succinyl-diaminopimelate desuccinylase n=1 Tax=Oceanobacillus chungangensis TaxID=1229152 RepID=A0A3D8PKW5_9BACI|nr:ArgE/DapE family deacylase [Oceanobacillus chungangensis]RDW16746.1 succinyl-diaminopimelate desuccinylase [Oceanobacillus chungangensis]